MNIGIQTGSLFKKFGIENGFKLIADAGFECVDFNIDNLIKIKDLANGKDESIFGLGETEFLKALEPYAIAAAQQGLSFGQIHAPFPTYVTGDESVNQYILEVLNKTITACGKLGCRHLIVHPAFGGYNNMLEYDDEWELNIKRYSSLIKTARKNHVVICLENMFTRNRGKIFGAICSDLNEAAAYVDELNEISGDKCFAFCYDTGHGLLLGKDPYASLIQLGDRVETLHIHDNDGINDEHITPYTGILDWERFLKGLKAINYSGNLSFETFMTANNFPNELALDALKLTCATGRYFKKRLQEM